MRRLHQRELQDLFAFGHRGGLGRATAITDCIAEGPDHLMYMEGDVLVLLRDAGDELLAYYEGEVGWVKRTNVSLDYSSSSSSTSSHDKSTISAAADSHFHSHSASSTPSHSNSPYSTRSSQSTIKSWPSTPYTPHDVSALGIADAHEPGIHSSPVACPAGDSQHTAVEVHDMPYKRPTGAAHHQIPSPTPNNDPPQSIITSLRTVRMNTITPSQPSTSAPLPSARHPNRIPPIEAPPPWPSNQSYSGNSGAAHQEPASSRCSSRSSVHSEDSDASEDTPVSDLPYARNGLRPKHHLSPTPLSAALISLSALGVHHTPPDFEERLSLDSVQQPNETSTLRNRTHVVRHVEYNAGSLAVPIEAEYRQSFAADIARLSEVPSEFITVSDLRGRVGPYDGSPRAAAGLTVPSPSLPRSPGSRDLNNNRLSPRVDESEYPVTPGTFGGRTPNDDDADSNQFIKEYLPQPPTMGRMNMNKNRIPPAPPIAPPGGFRIPPRNAEPVQIVEMERPSPPSRKTSSACDSVDSSNHPHSEETVLHTPHSLPIGTFDSPGSDVGIERSHLGTPEAVHPDQSMTDPLPLHKEHLPTSLSANSASLSTRGDSLDLRPDSFASFESRWSMESRVAAKMTGFYALGHSPMLTESQRQSWKNLSAQGSVDLKSVDLKANPLPSPLHNCEPTTPDEPEATSSTTTPTPTSASATGPLTSIRAAGTVENKPLETPSPEVSPASRPPPPGVSASPNHPPVSHERQISAPVASAPKVTPLSDSQHSNAQQQRRRPMGFVGRLDMDENPGPVPQNQIKDPRTETVPDSTDVGTWRAQVQNHPLLQQRPPAATVPVPSGSLRPAVGGRSVSHQQAQTGPAPAARPLVRRVTSPTTTTFSDSQHHPRRTILPSEMLMRQQRQHVLREDMSSNGHGSSDDAHSYSQHSYSDHASEQLHRSMLPTRTTSSSDGHNTMLVSLPSEIFTAARPAPRYQITDPGHKRVVAPPAKAPGTKFPIDPIPSFASRHGNGSPGSTQSHRDVSTSSKETSLSNDYVEVIATPNLPAAPNGPTLTRGRSRSFSAAIAKSLGKGGSRRGNPPGLSINTGPPPIPRKSKQEERGPATAFESTLPKPGFLRTHSNGSSISGGRPSFDSNDSNASVSRPWLSHTRSTSSGAGKSQFRPAVSHRDYADPTINADGMEFEIIQPRKVFADPPMVRASFDSNDQGVVTPGELRETDSINSNGGEAPPELDEWGFLRYCAPTPQIFRSRQSPAEVRTAEQKWLAIINQPLGKGQSAPKKVRRMVIEHGVPPSLRGRVWEWFMSNGMNGRVPGLFGRLVSGEPGPFDEQIEHDIKNVYHDHSVFYRRGSSGQTDLRTLLRAYVHFAPSGYRTDIARLAGALLIHAVLEDAFWLLAGLFNGVLKNYYVLDTQAFIVDLNVFGGILEGSEPRIAQLFRSACVLPEHYLVKWWSGMFIRSLPWPTVLRLLDVVIAEGPRYLIIASLAILTLSRDRLLQLPRTQGAVIDYLRNLPQDSLLLPDTFMRACDQVKLRDEDLKKLRLSVKAQTSARS